MIQYFPIVTGSLTVLGNINVSGSITTSGSITISGSITSASFASTASFVALAQSASFVALAQSASFVANAQTASYVLNAVSSSFASTASFVALAQSASNAVSAQTASFANNLTVAGTLTAQTLVVQTITSSVDFVTGSTRFGSLSSNTHIITGSMYVTGAFYVATGSVGIGTISPQAKLHILNSAVGGPYFGQLTVEESGEAAIQIKGTNYSSIYFSDAANAYEAGIVYIHSTNNLELRGGGNTADLIITSAGNVGIGGITPYVIAAGGPTLDLRGPTWSFIELGTSSTVSGSTDIGYLEFMNGNNTRLATIVGATDGTALAGAMRFSTANSSGGFTERMRINSTGSVGIGTTNPAAYGFFAAVGTVTVNTLTGVVAGFSDNVLGTTRLYIQSGVNGISVDQAFAISTGGGIPTERMRITSAGNVVLGTSAAAFNGERLRVAGSTSANTPAMAITSANPNVSCPNGTATTVYTFPSYPRVMYYMVFVRFDTGTNANDYATYAIVAASSIASKLMTVVNGSAVTLTLSGLNVQINQTSGATQNAVVSVIQIFANGGSD
jgi:hypothetical protein